MERSSLVFFVIILQITNILAQQQDDILAKDYLIEAGAKDNSILFTNEEFNLDIATEEYRIELFDFDLLLKHHFLKRMIDESKEEYLAQDADAHFYRGLFGKFPVDEATKKYLDSKSNMSRKLGLKIAELGVGNYYDRVQFNWKEQICTWFGKESNGDNKIEKDTLVMDITKTFFIMKDDIHEGYGKEITPMHLYLKGDESIYYIKDDSNIIACFFSYDFDLMIPIFLMQKIE